MIASDYPVTFGYGRTDPPYGTAAFPYHRGEDRFMPVGTSVLVNGTQIGLSGQTGFVTGPHLHIGRFVNGADTNPNGGGFTLPNPVTVTDFGYDATNGNYVGVRDGQGIRWVYLHLNSSNVTVGEILKGNSMDYEDAKYLRYSALHRLPSDAEVKGDVGVKTSTKAQALMQSTEWLTQNDILLNRYPAALKQIEDLKKQLAAGGGTLPAGTYLKVDPATVVTVK